MSRRGGRVVVCGKEIEVVFSSCGGNTGRHPTAEKELDIFCGSEFPVCHMFFALSLFMFCLKTLTVAQTLGCRFE
jgi:hypothetical protein